MNIIQSFPFLRDNTWFLSPLSTNTGIPPVTITSRTSTVLSAFLSPEERADKIKQWGEIRSMTKEEAAANLSEEDLERYTNYYTEVREGVLKMQELAKIMNDDVDKGMGVKPKTKGQRKRDKWAQTQAIAAADAAAQALATPNANR